MSLSDVSGVFSRYFIVGFFLPAFFALMVLAITVSDHFYPRGYHPRTQGGILVLAGAALLLGLLLLGLHYPTLRIFEGYPLQAPPLTPVTRRLVKIQEHRLDRLERQKQLALDPDLSEEQRQPGIVAWRKLDWEFPDRARLLPTRFGNAIRAFEYYPFSRWGLDPISTWSRIEPLLSDQERELHSNAKTDVAFFINSTLASIAVGIMLIADEVAHGVVRAPFVWLYVLPFAVAYVLYRFAIGAAERWGTETRASLDLHRLELYERLGVRAPHSFSDERKCIAPRLNKFFLYAEQLPDNLWRLPQSGREDAASRDQQMPNGVEGAAVGARQLSEERLEGPTNPSS